MNLTETVQALEVKNILIATDLGAHQNCAIDSNCPLAVELRRTIVEAGVTLAELLDGYEEVTAKDPVNYDIPDITSEASMTIAGKEVKLDINDLLSGKVKEVIEKKKNELADKEYRIRMLGRSLHKTYLNEVKKARTNHTLPQLSFPVEELLKHKCSITGDGHNRYVFLFQVEYKPEYVVQGGMRYKIADKDIKAIRRDGYLKFVISGRKILTPDLIMPNGAQLKHYHGTGGTDCWGKVRIPSEWDGELKFLTNLVRLLMGSLATINRDSMRSHGGGFDEANIGMPHVDDLIRRGKELGREGMVDKPSGKGVLEKQEGENLEYLGGLPERLQEITAAARTGWGRGRTTEAQPGIQVDVDGEMMIRYGAANHGGNMELICALCGVRVGYHTGTRGEECPHR